VETAPKVRLVNAHFEPLVGAVILGLENLGQRVEGQILANLEQSAQKFELIRQSG